MMSLAEIILLSLALAADCFTVALASGMIMRRRAWPTLLRMALLFGLFQALMPLLGWLFIRSMIGWIQAVDHWIAFGLLCYLGVRMIIDAFKEPEERQLNPADLRTQLLLAVATSIDALAVGISMACNGYASLSSLTPPLASIGAVSFLASVAGWLLGERSGAGLAKKIRPELFGGLILIGIGVKVLLQHLFQL